MMKKLLFIAVCVLCTFTSTIFAQTNLGLEAWSPNGAPGPPPGEDPDDWGTLNGFMFLGFPQTTFKDSMNPAEGTFSAMTITDTLPGAVTAGACSDTASGMLFLGFYGLTTGEHGVAYTSREIKRVNFMYKYMPVDNDTGAITVTLSHYDTLLDSTIKDGVGLMLFTQLDTPWTAGSVAITWITADTPDTLQIVAAGSAVMFCESLSFGIGEQRKGTKLWLDDFVIDTTVTGIDESVAESKSVNIFPNPANSSLTIHSKDPADPILLIEVYNATGQLVRRVFNVNITSRYVLKRKGLPSGLYMINVKTKEHNVMKKVMFE
ncbi:MAG: T9SS type A sorting domain-containing protein [Cytophagales bacterium]|nr:T9SS type A sorting domain-containing protein [Cytophagales bacterium]